MDNYQTLEENSRINYESGDENTERIERTIGKAKRVIELGELQRKGILLKPNDGGRPNTNEEIEEGDEQRKSHATTRERKLEKKKWSHSETLKVIDLNRNNNCNNLLSPTIVGSFGHPFQHHPNNCWVYVGSMLDRLAGALCLKQQLNVRMNNYFRMNTNTYTTILRAITAVISINRETTI